MGRCGLVWCDVVFLTPKQFFAFFRGLYAVVGYGSFTTGSRGFRRVDPSRHRRRLNTVGAPQERPLTKCNCPRCMFFPMGESVGLSSMIASGRTKATLLQNRRRSLRKSIQSMGSGAPPPEEKIHEVQISALPHLDEAGNNKTEHVESWIDGFLQIYDFQGVWIDVDAHA